MNTIYSQSLLKDAEKFFEGNTLPTMFARVLKAQPDKVCLFDTERAFTYRDVERMSNQIASAITRIGITPGAFMAVMSGRSLETLIAILGIWKAGCAYVFLDREYPEARNLDCMKECGARLIMTAEFIRDAIRGLPEEDIEDRSTPKGIAVVVYTSGTTHHPKGVLLTHENILASASNFRVLGITSEDVYGSFANLMFVASVYDLAVSMVVGCPLTLIPKDIRKNIHALADFYKEQKITVTFLPPHMAVKYEAIDADSPLRLLICGSEPARNLSKRSYRIAHVYASSEACAVISCYFIEDRKVSYPIGQIMPDLKAYIVNADGTLVSGDAAGELWISGPQVSIGYLLEPEADSLHYGVNPFSMEEKYTRVYKTGDLVSRDPDGNLIFHGRMDGMVKVRGFRIELSAVENCMLQFPEVSEAHCVVYKDAGGEDILFGYFTGLKQIDHGSLRTFMGMSLPYYMIPTGLIQLPDFARNRNGKVDRHQFIAPPEINDHKLLAKIYY